MLEKEELETNTVPRSDLGAISELQFLSCFMEFFKVLKMLGIRAKEQLLPG